jgi:voltage-gated potassium channel Kch
MAVPAHYQPFGGRMIQFFLTLRRLVRGIAAAWRRDPQFRSLCILVVLTLLSGTLFYRAVKGWSLVDAFYFSVTTLTTVGLGDLAPTTTFGKLFTTVYIFAGLGLIAGFVNAVARETLSNRGRGRASAEEGAAEDR